MRMSRRPRPLKAHVLGFDAVDHDPIEAWVPADPSDVDVWVNFRLGPDPGIDAGDNFLVRIATPNQLRPGESPGGRALVLSWYEWPEVLRRVQQVLDACEGDDWSDVAGKLSRHFQWEYEGYR